MRRVAGAMTAAVVAVVVAAALALLLAQGTLGVDRSKFRTCGQTSFCRRNREHATARWRYRLDPDSVSLAPGTGTLTATVRGGPQNGPALDFSLQIVRGTEVNDGSPAEDAVRVRITEKEDSGYPPRWEAPDVVKALEAQPFEVVGKEDPRYPEQRKRAMEGKDENAQEHRHVALAFAAGGAGGDKPSVVVVQYHPLVIELYDPKGNRMLVANERSLFHFEWRRSKDGDGTEQQQQQEQAEQQDRHHGKEIVDYGEDGKAIYADGTREADEKEGAEAPADDDKNTVQPAQAMEDGAWEEQFHTHHDSKPHGPTSVGMDIDFPGAQHVYGIPEHAAKFALENTRGAGARYEDPYRLYNLDVFEYELHESMALYGSIPVMLAHNRHHTVGIFWNNPSETFIDVETLPQNGGSKGSRWISESGVIDLFLLPGPRPEQVLAQYTAITGRPQLPPSFALGFHQCRWNYNDEQDVANVESHFEDLDYPMDVIWLDIEHTNGKRYFTWDGGFFPNSKHMLEKIDHHGRKMVTIVDPHLKREDSYRVHKEAKDHGYYLKDKNGKDFDGWCWPGSSSWPDFTTPEVRDWWAGQFAYDKYEGSAPNLFTWNDMNEPSVFNGPEVSINKDAKNIAGVENREWHNLYGAYFHRASAEGLVKRDPEQNKRPFVLSRAFYAGSQQYGAIWTGDNAAEWDHLRIAVPMLLSVSIAGLPFAGADVGGFFGNPDGELFTRWTQAGAFQPFFRAHAHIDSKRREPWIFGDPYMGIAREVTALRYTYMPFFYTTFHEAWAKGTPVMRPLWFVFPDDVKTFATEDAWMVGNALLVRPVTDKGATTANVYLPSIEVPWYDALTGERVAVRGGQSVQVQAPLDKLPLFQCGGTIVPRKLRLRRATKLMFDDPLTYVVALDADQKASGKAYFDDEETFNFDKLGQFAEVSLSFDGAVLRSTSESLQGRYSPPNRVERIVVYGFERTPKTATLQIEQGPNQGPRPLSFSVDPVTQAVTVKKPDVGVSDRWSIAFSY